MAQQQSSQGLGFSGALFLVFLVLKLTETISWSWWWVTAPLWGPLILVAVFLLCALPFIIWSKN